MDDRPPPTMAPWNLGLRFALELAALAGLALGGWALGTGPGRWVAALVAPVAAVVVWGTFNAPGDPSRSGEAPVPVPGVVRLLVEFLVLGGGAAGFVAAGWPWVGLALAVATVVHYGVGFRRLSWLMSSRPADGGSRSPAR